MTMPRVLVSVLLGALLFATSATARVSLLTRDEPLPQSSSARSVLGADRVLAPRTAPTKFNLVGLHWRGSGDVWFRTARAGGAWSVWRPARPEAEDLPDAGTSEAARRHGWTLGNPYWTGAATRIQYRLLGHVTHLRTHFLWSPETAAAPVGRLAATEVPLAPAIVTRAQWGADESIVRGGPSYADDLAFAVVHHTAGTTPSSPSQSAAVVRGVMTYHVRSNGWNDIGYNFLVDPFGQVFEGRGGGITRNVIGAHAQGFNTGSVGVALLGTYESKEPTPAAEDAIAGLLAWRLDLAHVDPASRVTRVSSGSSKWTAGTPVALNAVSGHRDVGLTACPGALLYGQLATLAADAASRGAPKIFEPKAEGSVGGPVRFTARLSTPLPWRVTVFDAVGSAVAAGNGSGQTVNWTWDARGAAPGRYTYGIEADGARPVRQPLGGGVPLELAPLTVRPTVITPNGDGSSDAAELGLTVTTAATAEVWLEDQGGTRIATLWAGRALERGTNTLVWRGASRTGATVADGRYRLVARASLETERVEREATITVDRTLGHLTASPDAFSPNRDGRRDAVSVRWRLAKAADVRLRVLSGSRVVATVRNGRAQAGAHDAIWEGAGAADGRYTISVEATTSLGVRRLTRDVVVDTRAPKITGLTARRERRGTHVRFWLSEPARVAVAFGGRTIRLSAGKGRVTVWRRVRPARVSAAAADAAGNMGASVTVRVRRG